MRTVPFYFKVICISFAMVILASCESEPISEEVGLDERETFQKLDKEDVQIPGED